MKKRMVVAMGWLLMALLLLPVGAMAQATHDVKITVKEGRPVAKEATVTIMDANGKTYTGKNPDRKGIVTVPNVPELPEGTVTVWTKINGKDIVVTAPVRVNEIGEVTPNLINVAYAKPVEVTVVDAVTKRVIEGAAVTVGVQEAKTNGDGKVTLSLLARPKVTCKCPVSVTKNGYAESTVTLEVDDKGVAKPSTIELKPLREVTIKVTKNRTGVSGATVKIVDADGKEYKATQTTGTTGEAVVQNVPVLTEGTVTVEQSGQVVMTAPVKVNEAGTAEPDNIDISQAKAVVVTVVDAKDESVIPGATVAVGAQDPKTDNSGEVTLNLLGGTTTNPVQYRIVAKAEGYDGGEVIVSVDDNGIANPITIKLTPVRDVTITVVKGGKPVKKATVTIVDDNGDLHERKTDDNGNASLRQVPVSNSGTLTVTSGSTVMTAPVKVNRDGTAKPNTIDLKNPNIASVAMTVVDEWGGPIPSGTVTVGAQEAEISDGKVRLSLLGGTTTNLSKYQMVAEGPDIYAVSTVVVSVNDVGEADLDTIKLKRKERVMITVVNNDHPVNGATVKIVDAEGNKCKVTTGPNGELDVPKMAGPTEWTVTVEKVGKVVTVPVKVDEKGKVRPDRIDIAKTWGVEVTVIDAVTEKGIEGAKVTVGAQTVTADVNGKVTLNLLEGVRIQYQVETTADGYVKSTERRRVKEYNSSNPSSLGTIELIRLTGVTITVVNGNSPVESATVTIVDANGKKYEKTTGSDGKVMVENVPVLTDWTVTVKAITGGEEKTVTVPVKIDGYGHPTPATIDFQNPKIVPVTMMVVDVYGIVPIITSGTVTVGTQKATIEGGKVTLYLLGGEGVQYQMEAEASEFRSRKVAVSVKDDGTAYPDKIELEFRNTNTDITVTDKGTCVSGAMVTIVGGDGILCGPEYTNLNGKVTVHGVSEVTGEGMVTVRTKIDGNDTVVTVPVKIGAYGLATPDKIDLGGGIKPVEVTVVDAMTGKAIAGATVTVGTQTVMADDQGKVKLNLQIKKKGYPVLAKAEGYEANTVKVSVNEGGNANPNTIKLTQLWEVEFDATEGRFANGRRWRIASVAHGKSIEDSKVEEKPTREGYTFAGWLLNGKAYNLKQPVEADITLTAVWVAKHTVTLDYNDGKTPVEKQEVEDGKTASKPADPTRDGYAFKGWYQDGATDPYNFDDPVNANIALKAKWVAKHTVTLDYNDGKTAPVKQEVEDGKTASKPADPARTGFTFKGWNLPDGTGYDFTKPVNADITLKAEWEANGTAQWTVTFDYNDGVTAKKELKVDNGTTVTKPADPARTGFTFKGWNLPDGTGYDFTKPVNADITLKAEWTVNKYTVTVKTQLADGTAVSGVTVRIGAQAALTTGPDGQVTAQLPNGTYTVAVQKAGYKETGRTPEGLTVDGQDAGLTVTLAKVETPNPGAATGTLELTVTGEDGQPLAHEKVTIGGKEYTTDDAGRVTLQAVPVGTSTVPVAKEGYEPASVDVTIKENETTKATVKLVKASSGATPQAKTYTVTVKTQLADGTAVRGATVRIGAQAPAKTNSDGQVAIQLPDGAYPVAVQKAGYVEKARTPEGLTVDGAAAELTVTLAKLKVYLNVFVVDQDLKPIVGADVTRVGAVDTANELTNVNGLATFSVDTGKYDISVNADGYNLASSGEVRVEKNGLDFTFVLQKMDQNNGNTTPVESELLAGVEMYPNPASVATVLHGVESAKRIAVYALTGVRVLSQAVHGETETNLRVESLAEGVYVVVVESANGERRALKLVVRR